ncbi:MAG TPA: type II and III secretion system protein [Candidatus Babeliales bacterium]|nr:type II and III secretion system protein [Candidatus Babeliales bacterium]
MNEERVVIFLIWICMSWCQSLLADAVLFPEKHFDKRLEQVPLLSPILSSESVCDRKAGMIERLVIRNATIEDIFSLIAKNFGIQIFVDPSVCGKIKKIDFNTVPIEKALLTLCEQNDPQLVLTGEFGVYKIFVKDFVSTGKSLTLQESALVPINNLESQKEMAFEKRSVLILHQKITEEFKARIAKMWHGITKGWSSHGDYYLVSDENSHMVFFRGRSQEVAEFAAYLVAIDRVIPQVKIEARMVVANKGFEKSFGLQWSSLFNRREGIERGFGFVGSGPLRDISNESIPQSPESLMDWALNLFPIVGARAPSLHIPFVFGGNDLTTKRLNVVLNASEDKNEIRTILHPTLLTNHNEEAEILVGEKIPIEVIVKESIEGSLRDITTVNYKDVGVKLRVKPQVSASGEEVFLEIFVENSSVRPTMNKRFPTIEAMQSSSRVILKNGQTTLIGGLIVSEKGKTNTAFPFLSAIPGIGFFFRGTRNFCQDKELLIFITPTIVL